MDDSLYDLCLSKDLINEEIITDNLDMAKDYFMEEGIPLKDIKRIQRSPVTGNKHKLTDTFEDANLFEDVPVIYIERKFPIHKNYNSSSFSIDSWSIDSTLTESSASISEHKATLLKLITPSKSWAILISTIFICTIVMSFLLSIQSFETASENRVSRDGKYGQIS